MSYTVSNIYVIYTVYVFNGMYIKGNFQYAVLILQLPSEMNVIKQQTTLRKRIYFFISYFSL